LKYYKFEDFKIASGENVSLKLSYQVFGLNVNEGPVVIVNHSLTGDSNISGNSGWWNELVGPNKMINTNNYCVISINIPGNIQDKGSFNFENNWILNDVARLFIDLLKNLKIKKIHSIIGGSIGGGLVWEMGLIAPDYVENLIPIAADYKVSDWLISNTYLQNLILKNSKNPVFDARVNAMISYRNAKSLNKRFKLEFDDSKKRKVIEWLDYHGKKLSNNISVQSYIHMNNLLSSIGKTKKRREDFKKLIEKTKCSIHLVGIDSDLLFPDFEIQKTYDLFSGFKKDIFYHQIKSDHGHDAFLIEFKKIESKLNYIFKI
jgi:homoserine O-acetyltransferase